MKDIKIRQGASFERTFTDPDLTADTLTITITDEDGNLVASAPSNYSVVDNKAVATVSLDADFPLGDYRYMYTIVYQDGFKVKLPDPSKCKDKPCELPLFTVCTANDTEES